MFMGHFVKTDRVDSKVKMFCTVLHSTNVLWTMLSYYHTTAEFLISFWFTSCFTLVTCLKCSGITSHVFFLSRHFCQ